MTKKANQLITEKSPYLLQHAYNPVDWYPWGEEAFARARQEDKPVFLSIGYSTCHWCHVMERESFEDQEVADFLNQHFISVKVDREERPDVDSIYMKVCQALTGRGGWPLTVIMTAEMEPFFAGTYFPKESRGGRPGLLDILTKVQQLWDEDREELLDTSNQINSLLAQIESQELTESIANEEVEDLLDQTYYQLKADFDQRYGGFGVAPKFPTPHKLMFLLRYQQWCGEQQALNMVEQTLEGMDRGGIYDQLGYGFSRYSTDAKWLAPHFEKMLYDNALLAIVYLEAYQLTDRQEYAEIAREIFTYILRDMTDEKGGFYSAEDADSEGVEGKFYLWTPAEVKEILGEQLGAEFCTAYDITEAGNFEGQSIPNLIKNDRSKLELDEQFAEAKKKLFEEREKRIHPHKDDKILTSWNGLMIAALAIGSKVLGEEEYLQAAQKAVDFIWKELYQDQQRLLARYREGEADYLAYVDDYAFLIWGLIELYESSFAVEYLNKALTLNQELLEYFWDQESGGLYFYGSDAEELLTRPKEIYDGAIPAGNSVAMLNFLRLARLTGDSSLEDKAEQQLRFFWQQIAKQPTAHTYFMLALLFRQARGKEVVIVGDSQQQATQQMLQLLREEFNPFTVTLFNSEEVELTELIPFLEDYQQVKGQPTAYICEDFSCQAPITDIEKFKQALS
ncbi:thioredoxin domain-containing protein [Fuchsiella alkaliacetigena]|uniref:thioredoxin domain-containing protein n=1 Tax=Fuchsiella alkaliacetigena TaxID=957042 RepID=UPI00200B8AE5|nr:thioredoxin domain-containing protein [Fuchsiella alkaliacetigena]MCK8824656.1 thioredoxin domain-containing protein [Fuchsiella alkaliacetigena]